MTWLEQRRGLRFATYQSLWEWSVTEIEEFWASIWDYFEVTSSTPYRTVLADRRMPGAEWFSGAQLNFAEHVVRGARRAGASGEPVIIARSQTRAPVDLTAAQLAEQVARARAGLARLGVTAGDRVAAYLPHIPEAIVASLACASLGAIWSSCPPEFGIQSTVDRLAQIEPKVLIAVDGYRYGADAIDRTTAVEEIRAALPSLHATVGLSYLRPDKPLAADAVSWERFMSEPAPLTFDAVPFDHPLYILFSSGTTGLPKAIVHSHGGVLLEHLKSHSLHQELGPGDCMFFFTTTGWMVWNWIVSALAVGSRIVLFDGNPTHPDLGELWRVAAETRATFFGGSAPFFTACRKAALDLGEIADLSSVRTVCSTGAPLPPDGYEWIYDSIGPDLYLQSTSGGTDVCGAFVGGSAMLPVRAGEIACRCLGCHVQAFDSAGHSVIGDQGELVVTEPMPSMPLGFWNDPDGTRLRAAYFETFPGAWRHGDWITLTPSGAAVISGRSDATLNRGGVRLGTSEFYVVVEAIPEIVDSLVVHLEEPSGGVGELMLFVVLAGGADLNQALEDSIRSALRRLLSPRHVPDLIERVAEIPRTLTGKKLEVPVKRILGGTPAAAAASRGALANPGSLDHFERLADLRNRSLAAATSRELPP